MDLVFCGMIKNHFPKEQGFSIEELFCQKLEFSIYATQNSLLKVLNIFMDIVLWNICKLCSALNVYNLQ
jgi:hypothetical protein